MVMATQGVTIVGQGGSLMCDSTKQILEEIELLRARLTDLAGRLGLDHPEVRRLSRKMDSLVVAYYRVTRSNVDPASGRQGRNLAFS